MGRVAQAFARGGRFGRFVVDFVLPPRCAGCGAITDVVGQFCHGCWGSLEFLGDDGCARCGQPLEGATAGMTCGACLADPPPFERVRSVIAYGDVARAIVLRFKYQRKVALARTFARYMKPLVDAAGPDAVLVPVPLHRSRLRSRGFNQSLLVARELARLGGWAVQPALLRRVKATPPLRGMSADSRRRTVSGAFAIGRDAVEQGRTIVLVDDVVTTGATAEGCARVLRKAGAERIMLVSWARVARPRRVD